MADVPPLTPRAALTLLLHAMGGEAPADGAAAPAHVAVAAVADALGAPPGKGDQRERAAAGVALLDVVGVPPFDAMRHVSDALRERLRGAYLSNATLAPGTVSTAHAIPLRPGHCAATTPQSRRPQSGCRCSAVTSAWRC